MIALLNRKDTDHVPARAALLQDPGPWLVPAGILAEVAYLVETNLRLEVLEAWLDDLETGVYTLECGEQDLPCTRELIRRYADLPLGFADAAVIACAERHRGRVLTLDLRDFGVVAREGRITLACHLYWSRLRTVLWPHTATRAAAPWGAAQLLRRSG